MSKIAGFFIPLIILAAVFSYFNSLNNEFVWDDEDFILKNSTVKDWMMWPRVFTENTIHGARKGSNFYRPLQSLTHGVDYAIWKEKTAGHHATNIIFHIMASVAAYLALKNIFSGRLSFFAALFFAAHPVQTEAVTYISGRSDPMAAFFVILAIILFERHFVLSCLSFGLALMSKESGLIAPFLIILYYSFPESCPGSVKAGRRILFKNIIPFVVIAVIYAALRLTVLDFSRTIGENLPQPYFYVPFYMRLCTFLKALPVYFSILLWPFGLHMERQLSLGRGIFEPQVFLGLLIAVSLFFIAYRARRQSPALLFSVCWFFIAMLPNSNLIPINALIYEHWLYLPSLGFFIAIAWAFEELFKRGKVVKYTAVFLAIFLTLFYIWRANERNREWRDHVSFYESTIRHAPDSGRLHNNLAMAYADRGRIDDAIKEYKRAITLGDYYPQPHFNLANIYINKGDYDSAIKELKRSVEIDNNFLYSRENLAVLYFNKGMISESKNEAEFILRQEPDNKIAREMLKKY